MKQLSPFTMMRGDGTRARVIRGTLLTFLHFGGSKMLRLLSNLVLTRILFPEAFGMMALVTVFIGALDMFSDLGVNSSIIQSKRGHDARYLNTAWTVQILRGLLLYIAALCLAGPVARFYDEPMLADLLPVAAVSAVILGFGSTKEATANKKILLGRITTITLSCQALAIAVNIVLSLWLQSVWGLIFGPIVANVLKVILTHTALPGERNRLAWNWDVFWDIFHFGKYIFISSVAGFFINQGDRAILGKFVTLSELAVYNIGLLIASVPVVFNRLFGRRVLFPLYAEKPPSESDVNRKNILRVRFTMTAIMLSISLFLGVTGDWLIQMLYLPAYHLAGPIVVLVALASMPGVIITAYGSLLLGTGDSRSFTIVLIATAIVQTGILWFGVPHYGLAAAILAPPLAVILIYPLNVLLVQRHNGWNPLHDGFYALVAAAIATLVLSLHSDAIARVLT